MEYILNHWAVGVCAFGACVYIGWGVYAFFRRPKAEQIEAVKQWLLGAVYDAEMAFADASGAGVLKLRMVYDLFVARFPWVAKAVSFDTFHGWVKEALEQLPGLIKSIKPKQIEEVNEEVAETRAIGFYMEAAGE
jgi:hypothetical protein